MKITYKAILLGILSSLFFASTFLVNRAMNLSGSHPLWNGCLRYFWTLPLYALLLVRKHEMKAVITEIEKNTKEWILWSTVGFGIFYFCITMSSVYGAAWLIASCWQITIVLGILITPLFGKKIPIKNLIVSLLIVVGAFLLQIENYSTIPALHTVICVLLLLIAATCYPLGNRKMMVICENKLNTTQRIFGMVLCSMPFWLIVSIIAFIVAGPPTINQTIQSLFVAILAGVVGTLLFFQATNLVHKNPNQLAAVEATQVGEVIFSLLLGIIFLKDVVPGPIGLIGIFIIICGIIANSFVAKA